MDQFIEKSFRVCEKHYHEASYFNSYKRIAMKILKRVLAALLLMIFIACNGTYSPEKPIDAELNQLANEVPTAVDSVKFAPAPPGTNEQKQGQPTPKIDWDKKIVKNYLKQFCN